MKIILTSDFHGHYKFTSLPDGDILICAGDYSARSNMEETINFLRWFNGQPYKHKIFICGNHQTWEERNPDLFTQLRKEFAPNCIYLENSGIEIEGFKIWGSPQQPWFFDWAYNVERGNDIQLFWDKIPSDTQVLITHGPPMGILDLTPGGEHVGCENLRNTINARLDNLKIHCFGHIHNGAGQDKIGDAIYINASLVNERYELVHDPIVIEL